MTSQSSLKGPDLHNGWIQCDDSGLLQSVTALQHSFNIVGCSPSVAPTLCLLVQRLQVSFS